MANSMINSSSGALLRLVQGNQRYLSGVRSSDTLSSIRKLGEVTRKGQNPFATILTCSDSRLPAEILFDCDVGDLFMIRVAGAGVCPSVLASVEFAALTFGTPLCVVMGHTDCGAIKATVKLAQNKSLSLTAHIKALVNDILPVAQEHVERSKGCCDDHLFDQIALENARRSAHQIAAESPFLMHQMGQGKFRVVSALCDVNSGIVKFDSSESLSIGSGGIRSAQCAEQSA